MLLHQPHRPCPDQQAQQDDGQQHHGESAALGALTLLAAGRGLHILAAAAVPARGIPAAAGCPPARSGTIPAALALAGCAAAFLGLLTAGRFVLSLDRKSVV